MFRAAGSLLQLAWCGTADPIICAMQLVAFFIPVEPLPSSHARPLPVRIHLEVLHGKVSSFSWRPIILFLACYAQAVLL